MLKLHFIRGIYQLAKVHLGPIEAALPTTVGAWSMVVALWQQYEYYYYLYLTKGWDNNKILLYKLI